MLQQPHMETEQLHRCKKRLLEQDNVLQAYEDTISHQNTIVKA